MDMITTKNITVNSKADAARVWRHTLRVMEQNDQKWNGILYTKNNFGVCEEVGSLSDVCHNYEGLMYTMNKKSEDTTRFFICPQTLLGGAKIMLHSLGNNEIIPILSYNVDNSRKVKKVRTLRTLVRTPLTNLDHSVFATVDEDFWQIEDT